MNPIQPDGRRPTFFVYIDVSDDRNLIDLVIMSLYNHRTFEKMILSILSNIIDLFEIFLSMV